MIYRQIPNFDGGVLILERDTNKILALNGGFNYISSGLNMVTEKNKILKKRYLLFLIFLFFDQNIFLNINNDVNLILMYKNSLKIN